MPRKKSAIAHPSHDEEPLPAAVEALQMQVEALTSQVEALYQVLDEIREDFRWALQNDKFQSRGLDQWRPVVHITSMPKDPCAANWEINRVRPEDLPPDPPSTPAAQTSARQAELWD